ncbi:MAG: hypothetical protein K6T99_07325 [Armatimonadetes bacterium]|nr:hypothetical protein [Armatimonadota bacterium]
MDEQEIVARARHAIIDMALGDVRKASAGGAKMGAFILAACVIDYLTCLYAGHDSNASLFREFVARFFDDKRYDPNDLWDAIRCKLLHSYTVKDGRYAYTDGNPQLHFKQDKSGRIHINLEDFISAVERAAENYFALVECDSEVRKRMVGRIKRVGILTVFEPKF